MSPLLHLANLANLPVLATTQPLPTDGGGQLGGRAHLMVAVAFGLTVVFILSLVRRRQLRGKYAMLWLGVALSLLPLVVYPDLLTWVAEALGVYYEPTVLIFAVLGFLLLVTMHFSWELSRLEDRSRTLAEEVALLRAQLEEATGPPPGTPGTPVTPKSTD